MSAGEVIQPTDANGDAGSRALLVEIRARLAEVDARPPDALVVGAWEPSEDVCILALAGEMDMANASELTRMVEICVGSGARWLILEASRLAFLDSTGLNQIVAVARPLKGRGGETLLAAPSAHVARLFEIVKLESLITIVASLEDALSRAAVLDADNVAELPAAAEQ